MAYLADFAARSAAPVLVYHVPYRTGQVLPAGALRRIAALDNVAGMKLAVGGIDAVTVDLLADPPPGFAVLAGDDAFFAPLLTMGVRGGILASAHVATASFAALAAGDQGRGPGLARLSLALFAEPNPTVIKAVLHAQGRIPTPSVRLPLLPAAGNNLRAALQLL
ncbi:dihydrodipicolinate synthase family protein [Actinoplanes sp. NPDC051494]|uniref:dihydrodipicolinate synthase family protein n=1 Tax=Actinoplanes sp. NPDC051494 TaxID=3363907 RepID=UPI0037AD31D9